MRKNYEKYSLLNFLIIVLFILLTFLFILFFSFKISIFQTYQGVFIDDHRIQLFVPEKDYLLLLHNSTFYLENHKYSYKIENIEKNVFQREVEYDSILLNFSSKKKRKVNDVAYIRVLQKKEKFVTIFQIIWKDDLDGKTK